MRELPALDEVTGAIELINDHATSDMRSSCVTNDLRVTEVLSLWPNGIAPSSKEGLLWKVANHGHKKRSVSDFADDIDEKKSRGAHQR